MHSETIPLPNVKFIRLEKVILSIITTYKGKSSREQYSRDYTIHETISSHASPKTNCSDWEKPPRLS